eukprot:CAMPEP_0185026846 /NCGR_PEP_ID=MMETSP1103-20130426/11372_1 /TAXON_ID=36769 /ORGANISM="Paraphysomonas bandaiensis, Strain Caron Lab Isolate" /LENGTH=138 /DNA_ID=CAMNT_0027560573 /DNA_START=50 /DNA_END=466 /DNA_ORIENTATION=+
MNDTSTKPKNQMLPPFNSVFGFEVKVPSSAVPSKLNLNKRKLEHKVFVVPTEFAEKEYTVQDHYAPADSKPPTQQAHGRWSREEHALFLRAISKHGRNLRKIAAEIPTRSYTQVRTHAEKCFSLRDTPIFRKVVHQSV